MRMEVLLVVAGIGSGGVCVIQRQGRHPITSRIPGVKPSSGIANHSCTGVGLINLQIFLAGRDQFPRGNWRTGAKSG